MPDEKTRGTRSTLRRIAIPLAITGIVLVAILLTAMEEKPMMSSPSATPGTNINLPPIDRAAPSSTKTATFAMG